METLGKFVISVANIERKYSGKSDRNSSPYYPRKNRDISDVRIKLIRLHYMRIECRNITRGLFYFIPNPVFNPTIERETNAETVKRNVNENL